MATLINERRLTAEEYFALPDDGRHKELVRGRILEMNMPGELSQQDHLTLPDVLPKFRVPVRHFFA